MRVGRWLELGWIPRAAAGRFRAEGYGFCCGYLSWSPVPARTGFLNTHGMSQRDRRAKAGGWRKNRITYGMGISQHLSAQSQP